MAVVFAAAWRRRRQQRPGGGAAAQVAAARKPRPRALMGTATAQRPESECAPGLPLAVAGAACAPTGFRCCFSGLWGEGRLSARPRRALRPQARGEGHPLSQPPHGQGPGDVPMHMCFLRPTSPKVSVHERHPKNAGLTSLEIYFAAAAAVVARNSTIITHNPSIAQVHGKRLLPSLSWIAHSKSFQL